MKDMEYFTRAYRLFSSANHSDRGIAAPLFYYLACTGFIRSAFYLAQCYDRGIGFSKNHSAAFYWYMRAAKNGHPESQYNVSLMYRDGVSVPVNHKKSQLWLKRAAAQGDADALNDIAVINHERGGPKALSITLYRRAARKGCVRAMYNLGLALREVDGTAGAAQSAIGMKWITKAAQLGHSKSKSLLRRMRM